MISPGRSAASQSRVVGWHAASSTHLVVHSPLRSTSRLLLLLLSPQYVGGGKPTTAASTDACAAARSICSKPAARSICSKHSLS